MVGLIKDKMSGSNNNGQIEKLFLKQLQGQKKADLRQIVVMTALARLNIPDRFPDFELSDAKKIPECSLVVGQQYRQMHTYIHRDTWGDRTETAGEKRLVYVLGFSERRTPTEDELQARLGHTGLVVGVPDDTTLQVLVCGSPEKPEHWEGKYDILELEYPNRLEKI
jgi:hypothetical protein